MSASNHTHYSYRNRPISKPKIPFAYSWFMIILTFFVFQPVSYVLMFQRSKIDKMSNLAISVIFAIQAGFILLLGIATLGNYSEVTPDQKAVYNFMTVFFFAWGGLYVYISSRCYKSRKRFLRVMEVIYNHQIRRIDQIAMEVGMAPAAARNYINELIMLGFIADAVVKDGSLVIEDEDLNEDSEADEETYEDEYDEEDDAYDEEDEYVDEYEDDEDEEYNEVNVDNSVVNINIDNSVNTRKNSKFSSTTKIIRNGKVVKSTRTVNNGFNEDDEAQFREAMSALATSLGQLGGDSNSKVQKERKPKKVPRSGTTLCKNCGATVVLKGFGPVACEYCDTDN